MINLEELNSQIDQLKKTNPNFVSVVNADEFSNPIYELIDKVIESGQATVEYLDQLREATETKLDETSSKEQLIALAGTQQSIAQNIATLSNFIQTDLLGALREIKSEETQKTVTLLEELGASLDNIFTELSIKEFNPNINVAAPIVNVPELDTKRIEDILKVEIPKTVRSLVEAMPRYDDTLVVEKLDIIAFKLQELIDKPTLVQTMAGGASGGSESLNYALNGIEEGDTTYLGLLKDSGEWKIIKITSTAMSYATASNNGTVTSYTDAWTNKATLTYGRSDQS